MSHDLIRKLEALLDEREGGDYSAYLRTLTDEEFIARLEARARSLETGEPFVGLPAQGSGVLRLSDEEVARRLRDACARAGVPVTPPVVRSFGGRNAVPGGREAADRTRGASGGLLDALGPA